MIPVHIPNARTRAVYEELVRAAETRAPCPTNTDISRAVDIDAPRVTEDIRALVRAGHISVRSSGIKRIVTITATGQDTAETNLARMNSQSVSALDQMTKGLGGDALAARIAADQARLREAREAHLIVEQTRYRLPKRGRLLEDMPL